MPHAAAHAQDASVDPAEIDRFSALAETWWDADGPMRPLHRLNPVRLAYIRDKLCNQFDRDPASLKPLTGLAIVDVGCGGGLLSEPLARLGADVVGIDAAQENIGVAQAHAKETGLAIDYRCTTAEALAAEGARFDAVVSMEVVEHVADLGVFLAALAQLTKPDGAVLLSTLNRTPKAWALAIVGAEYVLRWLPRGTHDWRKFVKPAELVRRSRHAGITLEDVTGMSLDMRNRDWRLSSDRDVNYLAYGRRVAA